jgi:predicted nucleic acid-binding protein
LAPQIRICGRVASKLQVIGAAGKPVGADDLLIAAMALSRGDKIISRDARSFPNIPSLAFEII